MSTKPKPKEKFLIARVSVATHTKFAAKASKASSQSIVLRELIDAYIDGRIIIQPK
jgi:hypothetical protein